MENQREEALQLSYLLRVSLHSRTARIEGEHYILLTFSFSQVISIQLCDSFDNFPMVMLMTSVLQDEMLTREINSIVCGSSLLRWNRPWYPRRCCDWLLGWYVHTPDISVPKAKISNRGNTTGFSALSLVSQLDNESSGTNLCLLPRSISSLRIYTVTEDHRQWSVSSASICIWRIPQCNTAHFELLRFSMNLLLALL